MNNSTLNRRGFIKSVGVGGAALTVVGCSSNNDTADTDKPHYVMVFDQTKCVGCGRCKDACNKVNFLPEGMARLDLERQTDRVEGEVCPKCGKTECNCERKYVRVSCQQCQNAPCVMVCPTGAAHRDEETGIVTMNPDTCAGCKYCITACPYNVRQINPDTKVADNCDFCLHTNLAKGELPGCVQECKFGALKFGNANDKSSYVSKLLAAKNTERVKEHFGTDPSLYYIAITKEEI
ncbi:4Fe-4S dicluster domain-containing protein [Ferrimonas lipolytica]|uniref:4Fe-4S binding protein n=1 Tax=Ferrimonas lipolytica TaxID=2724191 RepID=A0A6H1U8V4_9GAMM|nr:4Fe-4S dicluster domain-containing protein [Ferrimonas lipolytica]QIZ75475.1 4Fe-4S binding protein [Ferrimonas lipolytica]